MNEPFHPNALFETLAASATVRSRRSLEVLHQICQEQRERGSGDFSIPTVAKLSVARGGPGEQTIRNKTGERYRSLLAAWAAFAEGSTKKPQQKSGPLTDDVILSHIEDTWVRAAVGGILAQNKRLKAENQLLHKNASIIVDERRMVSASTTPAASTSPAGGSEVVASEVLPVKVGLSQTQIEALEHAISPALMEDFGWEVRDNGRVMKGERPVYKPGYVDAIKAILAAEKAAG